MCVYKIFHDIQVTILTGIMKRCSLPSAFAVGVTSSLLNVELDHFKMPRKSGKVKWCISVFVWTQWITVMCVHKVFHDIQVAILTGIMKRCSLPLAFAVGVTSSLLSVELDHFKMPKMSSKVKWCISVFVWTQWITVMCVHKVFHDIQVTFLTGTMKRCSLPLAFAVGVTSSILSVELDHFKMPRKSSKVKWCISVFVWTQWITVMCIHKVFHDIQVTFLTGIMKRYSLPSAFAVGVTSSLLSVELDHFKMPTKSSKVKWCTSIFVWT
jgi:ABC-type thiamin/hydroxymethylpyrimidine transport system permease subunit